MKQVILILTILLFLTSLAQATQIDILLKECVLSYDDDTFQEWDGARGIVERVTNSNPNFGYDEDPIYTYSFYQGEREYFDESGTYGTVSKLPILFVTLSTIPEAKLGIDTFAYIKCTFQVGDRFVPYLNLVIYPFWATPTNDFNLTTGIINDATKTKMTWQTSPLSYKEPALMSNTLSADSTLSTDTNSGVFPNTEFHKVYKRNLNDYPSSLIYLDPDFSGEGNSQLIHPLFKFYFYINNTNIPNDEIKQYLCPIITDFTATNINTSETYPPTFLIFPGEEIEICSTIENEYKTDLNNIKITDHLSSSTYSMGRIGGEGTDLSMFSTPTFIVETNLVQGEIKDICNTYTIPEVYYYGKPVAIPRASSAYYLKNEKGLECRATWPIYGSDNVSYLGIKGLTTAIEYDPQTKQAIFDVEMGLQVTYAYGVSDPNVIKILPDDYSIITRIYEDDILPENLAIETETILDQNEFDKIGETELTQGEYDIFNLQIPIEGALTKTDVKYIVKFYTKKLVEPFRDFIIADIAGTPYFEPGDIAYLHDGTLNFGSDSKIDSEKITIFNPSFYENDIKLDVASWSDEDNFTLSWDGSSFSSNPSQTIHLYPLQSKEITFWVNATYNPWVADSIQESLKINIQSNLKTDEDYIEKIEELSFMLDMNKSSLNWFNINPIGFIPEIIFLDNLNSTKNKEITLEWNTEGSDSKWEELIGESYNVTIKLINGTDPDGEVLKEIIATFIITEDGTTELTFDFDFSYGEYLVILDLDSNNQIAELYSSGDSAEEDNHNVYSIPFLVTNCYYNEDDGYMHRINFFGEDAIDKENKCECPSNFVTIPDEGYCADPYSEICSTFNLYSICNDWNQSKPGLCGWEAEVSPLITPGTCLNCSSISNTCSGYNNEETCEIDPCYKALLYDCVAFGCDTSQEYECVWDDTLNQCNFFSEIDGKSCNYFGNILEECNETNDKMIINYTSEDTGCEDRVREVICRQDTVLLNFFSKLSFIFAIILIVIFYAIKSETYRKNQPSIFLFKPFQRSVRRKII
ncbi:MAG: hypothetical protein ABIF18_00455 [archaeon]